MSPEPQAGTPAASDTIAVVASDELDPNDAEHGVDLPRWQALAHVALRDEGVTTGELNLVFIDDSAMADLNRDHMGGDGPTDVLAFPLDAPVAESAGGPGAVATETSGPGPVLLGDVVICPGVARRYAAERSVDFDDELALLVVHGVLHVLGHDHMEPDEEHRMRQREQALLEAHHR